MNGYRKCYQLELGVLLIPLVKDTDSLKIIQARATVLEFNSEAVRLSYQRENIKELADELGVQVQRIYKWRAGQKSSLISNVSIKPSPDSLEVKQLRKALKEKELELEILKKAVHIF